MREALLVVAAQAFAAPPWNEKPADAIRLIDRMGDAATRRDFAAVAAFDGADLIGFAYGHTDDRLAAMCPGGDGGDEAFEVIELAVAPSYQGQGVGRSLHDAMLAIAPSPRLLLTNPEAPARHAYRRWGWTEIGEVEWTPGSPVILMRQG